MDKNIEGISLSSVKANRQAHKLYGVRDAEIWSKEKTLIDFLEEIFNAGSSRKTTSALAKKVSELSLNLSIADHYHSINTLKMTRMVKALMHLSRLCS